MSTQVEFFFDVGNPTAYLAWMQLPALCAQAVAALVYRPRRVPGDVDEPLDPNDPATAAKALTVAGLVPAQVMGWANDAGALARSAPRLHRRGGGAGRVRRADDVRR